MACNYITHLPDEVDFRFHFFLYMCTQRVGSIEIYWQKLNIDNYDFIYYHLKLREFVLHLCWFRMNPTHLHRENVVPP